MAHLGRRRGQGMSRIEIDFNALPRGYMRGLVGMVAVGLLACAHAASATSIHLDFEDQVRDSYPDGTAIHPLLTFSSSGGRSPNVWIRNERYQQMRNVLADTGTEGIRVEAPSGGESFSVQFVGYV